MFLVSLTCSFPDRQLLNLVDGKNMYIISFSFPCNIFFFISIPCCMDFVFLFYGTKEIG